jgi:hypothetical protein
MATPPTAYKSSPPSSVGYGDRPALYGPRRSFTAPHRLLSHHERAGLDKSDASADTLYSHPSTRIIKFTPSTTGIPLSSKPLSVDTDYPVDAVEVLPWASTTESLLATGSLKIEKVRGSTNFLKCKDVNQAILRNSQCWLVDGVSKFVLRVGKLQYYRIELPAKSADDLRAVEDFKEALRKILRFEVTPCPFKRGFHVELADSALTPRRKGQWKRRDDSLPSSPLNSTTPPLRHKTRMWQPRATSYGLSSREETSPSRADSGYGQSPTDEKHNEKLQTPGSVVREQSGSEDESDVETRNIDEVSDEIEAMLSPRIAATPPFETEGKIMTPIKVSDTPSLEGDAREEVEDESLPAELAPSPAPSPVIEPKSPDKSIKPPSVPQIHHEESLSPPLEIPERIHSRSPANSLGIPNSLANSQESLLLSLLLADTRRPPQPFPEHDHAFRRDSEAELPEDGADRNYSRRPTLESIPDDISIAESTDSFHTSASIASNLNLSTPKQQTQYFDGPTPLAEAREHDLWSPHDRSHRRDISEMTITASTHSSPDMSKVELDSSNAYPSSPIIQASLRHRVKARRSLSPLPPSSTIVRSNRPNENNHMTAAILQKAASVALVKPVELVVLVVHILARIAGGATMNDLMSGDLFRKPPRERERAQSMSLPDGVPSRNVGISEDEDDYGVPIRGRAKSVDLIVNSRAKAATRDDDVESLADSLAELD